MSIVGHFDSPVGKLLSESPTFKSLEHLQRIALVELVEGLDGAFVNSVSIAHQIRGAPCMHFDDVRICVIKFHKAAAALRLFGEPGFHLPGTSPRQ